MNRRRMPSIADRTYLRSMQYRDASNLKSRMSLHAHYGLSKFGWFHWVFDHMDLLPFTSILELGCGTGGLWLKNIDRIPAGCSIILSDFSSGMIQEAEKNLQEISHSFNFIVADAQSVPVLDDCLDTVIANHMLYHVPDREKTFQEIIRILCPGGIFYGATNSETHMQELTMILRDFAPDEISDDGDLAMDFTTENGTSQLKKSFTHIELHEYEDILVIPEPAPLVAYVKSYKNFDGLMTEKFRVYLENMITRDGAVRIKTKSGLFIARI